MTTADAFAAVEKAQAIAQSGVVHELLDQADAVLDRLVGAYNGRTLTDRDAAVGIATIAELRRAASRGTHAIAKGVAAGEQLTRSER